MSFTARRSSQPMHNQRDGAGTGTHAASIFWWMDGCPLERDVLNIECIHSGEGGFADGHEAASAVGEAGGPGPWQPRRPTAGGPCRRPREAPSAGSRIGSPASPTNPSGCVIQRRSGQFCSRNTSAGLLCNSLPDWMPGTRQHEGRLRRIVETAPDRRRVGRRNTDHGFRRNRDLSCFFSCL